MRDIPIKLRLHDFFDLENPPQNVDLYMCFPYVKRSALQHGRDASSGLHGRFVFQNTYANNKASASPTRNASTQLPWRPTSSWRIWPAVAAAAALAPAKRERIGGARHAYPCFSFLLLQQIRAVLNCSYVDDPTIGRCELTLLCPISPFQPAPIDATQAAGG